MKKLTTLLFAVALLMGFSSVAMAQSSDDASINANATVVQGMQVGEESQDLDFNNILRNSAKFIGALNGIADASAAGTKGTVDGITGGESRGYFSIEIAPGASVDISLNVPTNIIDAAQGFPFPALPIDFSDTGDGGDNFNGFLTEQQPGTGPGGVTPISTGVTAGSNFTFDPGDSIWSLDNAFEMPESGKVYLVMGGEVSAASDQELGEYTGFIELTATIAN